MPWGAAPAPVGMGGFTLGGMPGCQGMVASMVPWCNSPQAQAQIQMQLAAQQAVMGIANPYAQPQVIYANTSPMEQAPIIINAPPQQRQYAQRPREHQMGGQGQIATPGGGAGWSWYADGDGSDGGES